MRVAVLGLGRMGAPIAERLQRAGHELSVWNRSPAASAPFADAGAAVLRRPADAWQHADVAITMLADDAAVTAVTLGAGGEHDEVGDGALLAGDLAPGRTVIDMSTISPAASAQVAEAAERHGTGYLRAPVSGNPSVVVAGNLGIIVSGDPDTYARCRPLLADIGPNLFYLGRAEQARVAKLALNLMIGGTTQLLAEAIVLCQRAGIDRGELLEVVAGSAIGSPYVSYKSRALADGDYSSTFTARLLHKDLSLALEAAHTAAVPLPVTALVQQLTQSCIAQGWGELDLAVLLPALERAAGEEPRFRA